jgi:hypothetical protein
MKSHFILYGSIFLLFISVGCGGEQEDFFVSQNSHPLVSTSSTSSIEVQQNVARDGQVFDQKNITTLVPLPKNRTLYYLKNGNIWTARVQDNQTVAPALFFDTREDILAFAVSPDQQLIAYSVKHYPAPVDYSAESEYGNDHGNVIMIRNNSDASEFELYNDHKKEHLQIRDLKFTSDSKKLVFSNDAIWTADLTTRQLNHYAEKERGGLCGIFYITDISPDNEHVLSRLGCAEGLHQIVVNIKSGVTESRFNGGYIEGGGISMLGFVKPTLLLGYANSSNKNAEAKIALYTISGKVHKSLLSTPSFPFAKDSFNPFYFDSTSNSSQIFFGLHSSDWPQKTNTISFYQLSLSDLLLQPFKKSNEVITLAKPYGKPAALWFTKTTFEHPIFIDEGTSVASE